MWNTYLPYKLLIDEWRYLGSAPLQPQVKGNFLKHKSNLLQLLTREYLSSLQPNSNATWCTMLVSIDQRYLDWISIPCNKSLSDISICEDPRHRDAVIHNESDTRESCPTNWILTNGYCINGNNNIIQSSRGHPATHNISSVTNVMFKLFDLWNEYLLSPINSYTIHFGHHREFIWNKDGLKWKASNKTIFPGNNRHLSGIIVAEPMFNPSAYYRCQDNTYISAVQVLQICFVFK